MSITGLSFETFFNAVYKHLGETGYANPGREAMNANAFSVTGQLGLSRLRALQFCVATLVDAGEIDTAYNARASAVVDVKDAFILLDDINQSAKRAILPKLD